MMDIEYRFRELHELVQYERSKLMDLTRRLIDLLWEQPDVYQDSIEELRFLLELLISANEAQTEGWLWNLRYCDLSMHEAQREKHYRQVIQVEVKLKSDLNATYIDWWHNQRMRYLESWNAFWNMISTTYKSCYESMDNVQKAFSAPAAEYPRTGLRLCEDESDYGFFGSEASQDSELPSVPVDPIDALFAAELYSEIPACAVGACVEDMFDGDVYDMALFYDDDSFSVFEKPPEPKSVSPDQVFFSAIAPRRFPEGEKTDLAVVMYEDEYSGILEQIKENYDSKVMIQGTGAKSVVKGTNIRVVIQSSDERVVVDSSEQEAVWIGKYLEFHFWVMVPEGFRKKQIELSVHIYTDQIRFSTLRFCVKCESDSLQQITPDRRDVRTAFVSYAREDAKAVSLLMQGIEKVRPDLELFMDLEKLRSGQNWREVLKREIEQRDILYLCWSAKARVSEWVDFEWRHMYRKRGIDYIDPIPLESPKICPPPTELSNLHFDERWIYYRNSNDPICCIRSNDDGTIIPFAKEQILVGREASADVVLRNNKISRKHLLITLLEKNQFLVQDLNSLNGSVVDGSGEKITFEGVIVPPGTKIRLAEDTVIEIL